MTMAKSEEIPIVTPNREYDNPFNDQTAFSPPQMNHLDDKPGFKEDGGGSGRGGGGVDIYADYLGGRERSVSQPAPTNLRDPAYPLFSPQGPIEEGVASLLRSADERGYSNPNLTSTKFNNAPPAFHPIDRTNSMPIRDAVEAEGLRGFHSAPVTPLGSRQGSPKTERRKGGNLLQAIFGAGIYGRQISDGVKPGGLGHLAEDPEDDFTPVGSPATFSIDELKTKLEGVDDRLETTPPPPPSKHVDVDLFGEPYQLQQAVSGLGIAVRGSGGSSGVGVGSGGVAGVGPPTAAAAGADLKKKKVRTYREFTYMSPSSS